VATRFTDEFRRDAGRIVTAGGLTRPQAASDLGVGLSTRNRWVQKPQHDDLRPGPHEDIAKEDERLRKEVRLLREEREASRNAAIFLAGQSRRGLLSSMPGKTSGLWNFPAASCQSHRGDFVRDEVARCAADSAPIW
jgi:transposase